MKMSSTLFRRTIFRRAKGGFSLIELMVTGGLVAALFVTTALVYRTVNQNQGRTVSFKPVLLGKGITNAFFPDEPQRSAFGVGTTEMPATIDVSSAPHYGTESEVSVMREIFLEDTAKSCGVFALPRGPIQIDENSAADARVPNVNYIHPVSTLDGDNNPVAPFLNLGGRNPAEIDHPNRFRELLLTLYPNTAAEPFPFLNSEYRGTPSLNLADPTADSNLVNASIFCIQPSYNNNALMLRCVWEIDLIRVDSANGVFASVRRYFGAKLTHFYHILYPDPPTGNALQSAEFGPVMACFERQARRAVTEGNKTDAFKVAPNRPFYLVWWPSPSMPSLRGTAAGATLADTDPRKYYQAHEQQTAVMFTIPLFPTL
jgi:hypothetical protein